MLCNLGFVIERLNGVDWPPIVDFQLFTVKWFRDGHQRDLLRAIDKKSAQSFVYGARRNCQWKIKFAPILLADFSKSTVIFK